MDQLEYDMREQREYLKVQLLKESKMEEVRVCLDIREKELAKRERKLAREQEKVMEKVREMEE